jgi:hypothetical protein
VILAQKGPGYLARGVESESVYNQTNDLARVSAWRFDGEAVPTETSMERHRVQTASYESSLSINVIELSIQ